MIEKYIDMWNISTINNLFIWSIQTNKVKPSTLVCANLTCLASVLSFLRHKYLLVFSCLATISNRRKKITSAPKSLCYQKFSVQSVNNIFSRLEALDCTSQSIEHEEAL